MSDSPSRVEPLERYAMTLLLKAAAKTDVGLVRANNEDNFGYDTRCGIFVVCDGVGGEAAGERASRIAVDTVLTYFRDPDRLVSGEVFEATRLLSEGAYALGAAVQLANQAIYSESAQSLGQANMGSTIVATLVDGSSFSIAHVGDSRIYRIREGRLEQLTSDHSLVSEQVRQGLLSAEEAENSPMKNIIMRALGQDENVEPDLADHDFASGDVLLLCSDGLSNYVAESTLTEAAAIEDLEEACDELIEAAKYGGSDDNITCLLVRVREKGLLGRFFSGVVPDRVSNKRST